MSHEPANTSSAAQPTNFTGTVASRRRVSEDGGEYTYAEFVEFFGSQDGAKRWLSAERRVSFDGYAYTYAEFVEFFGPKDAAEHWNSLAVSDNASSSAANSGHSLLN